jgi:RNA polymerase sigma-70 factor (ECF subfamily)
MRSAPEPVDQSTTLLLQARFQALVLPHLDRMVAFASRRLGNRADAEDVVQDSFVRAWQGFSDLRDENRVRSWLYRIVRSVLSDFRARRGHRETLAPMLHLEDGAEDVVVSDEPGPFERLADSLSSAQVHELLRMIPESFSIPVELHDIEGLRYHEIAEITGVPLGTVMSRIYRGRKLLASLIAAHSNQWDLPRGWTGGIERRMVARRQS